jgi:hypothetical protein
LTFGQPMRAVVDVLHDDVVTWAFAPVHGAP